MTEMGNEPQKSSFSGVPGRPNYLKRLGTLYGTPYAPFTEWTLFPQRGLGS